MCSAFALAEMLLGDNWNLFIKFPHLCQGNWWRGWAWNHPEDVHYLESNTIFNLVNILHVRDNQIASILFSSFSDFSCLEGIRTLSQYDVKLFADILNIYTWVFLDYLFIDFLSSFCEFLTSDLFLCQLLFPFLLLVM